MTAQDEGETRGVGSECRFELINSGAAAIPRSCRLCGLGGCKKGLPDPWRKPTHPTPDPQGTGAEAWDGLPPIGCEGAPAHLLRVCVQTGKTVDLPARLDGGVWRIADISGSRLPKIMAKFGWSYVGPLRLAPPAGPATGEVVCVPRKSVLAAADQLASLGHYAAEEPLRTTLAAPPTPPAVQPGPGGEAEDPEDDVEEALRIAEFASDASAFHKATALQILARVVRRLRKTPADSAEVGLREALRRIDELRGVSGKSDAEMLYEMRSIAKAALSPPPDAPRTGGAAP